MTKSTVIVDYGMGNIFSNCKALERLGDNWLVSSSPQVICGARRLILPGVGHFGKAMRTLQANGLVDALHEAVLIKRIPVLGICLGMQLMASFSEEGKANGLNWFEESVIRFRVQNRDVYKVPHVGWNTIINQKTSRLLHGLSPDEVYYFVHSYHFDNEKAAEVVGTTQYEYAFVSVVERENIYGVQFHPEKSHQAGSHILKNFLRE